MSELPNPAADQIKALNDPAELDAVSDVNSEDEEYDDRDLTPDAIRTLLNNPPVLPNECSSEFARLFECFEMHFNVRTTTEYWWNWEVTVLTWEIMRYRKMKVSIISNCRLSAAEAVFRKIHNASAIKGAEGIIEIEAAQEARSFLSNPAFAGKAALRFVAAGYSSDAVEVEAYIRALPLLKDIEALIASSTKRLNTFFKEIERRCGNRVEKYRWVANQEIDKAGL